MSEKQQLKSIDQLNNQINDFVDDNIEIDVQEPNINEKDKLNEII